MALKDSINPGEAHRSFMTYFVSIVGSKYDFFSDYLLKYRDEPFSSKLIETGRDEDYRFIQEIWSDHFIEQVLVFLTERGVDRGSLSDFWLLRCAVIHRTRADQRVDQESWNRSVEIFNQIETEVLPFLAECFEDMKRLSLLDKFKDRNKIISLLKEIEHHSAVSKEIEAKISTPKNKVNLKGDLAEMAVLGLKKEIVNYLMEIYKKPLLPLQKDKTKVVRGGWADSACFCFHTMKILDVMGSAREKKANSEHKRFIWDFLTILCNLPLALHYENTYRKEDAIKSLLLHKTIIY